MQEIYLYNILLDMQSELYIIIKEDKKYIDFNKNKEVNLQD